MRQCHTGCKSAPTYLSSLIDRSGRCEAELFWQIAITQDTSGSQHLALGISVSTKLAFTPYVPCQSFCMEQRPGQWQRQCQPRWMPLTNGACLPAWHPSNPWLQSTHVQRRSEASHILSTTLRDYPFQNASLVRSYGSCWSENGSLPSPSWHHQQPSTWMEKKERMPSTHLDPHCWGRSEVM